jgi:hypothetical protein
MKPALIVTFISPPNRILSLFAKGAVEHGWNFYLLGDRKSLVGFKRSVCRYLSMADQLRMPGRTSQLCPPNHYARKNIGDLAAIGDGAKIIVETDYDNQKNKSHLESRQLAPKGIHVGAAG